MKPKPSPPWSDLLEYLDGIGYHELYLEPGVLARRPSEGVRQPAGPQTTTRSVSGERHQAPPRRREEPRPSERRAAERRPPARQPFTPPEAPLPIPTDPVPDDPVERSRQLVELGRLASDCRQCRLCEGRRNVVFGSGHPNADLMFVGEGPGGQEDRRGLPFVGPAGELLTKIIRAIDLDREQVYIANVVKCRPPSNRDPQPDEVAACRPLLERQIDLVQPKLLVALGRVAAQCLLGETQSLGRMRGRWYTVRGVPTRVTYHPAALLRNSQWKRPTWEDMQGVRDRLRELAAGGPAIEPGSEGS